jgi:glyoxylase-like metal-dependent hydrolase (beta-lactamase superfamily II)/pimeloyl-ACP methyl ester carboxylesterase
MFQIFCQGRRGNDDVEMVLMNLKRSISDLNLPGVTQPMREPGARHLANDPQWVRLPGPRSLDHYAADAAAVVGHLALRDAVHVGHSTEAGEVTRCPACNGGGRDAEAVLMSAVPPIMVKNTNNPDGLPVKVFDGLRPSLAVNRAQFYRDVVRPVLRVQSAGAKTCPASNDDHPLDPVQNLSKEPPMSMRSPQFLSRRNFCICCAVAAGLGTHRDWLKPAEAFTESRNIVDTIRDAAATMPILVHKLRGDVTVIEGSGGNIAVLTGGDGKLFVDAGISATRPRILDAVNNLSRDPIKHLINNHWHFDHTDGNRWLNEEGAAILAHENTHKHLLTAQTVDDWSYRFPSPPLAAVPTEVFSTEKSVSINRSTLHLKYYGPAHTDSDISVTFVEADIFHCGDTYWNRIYPFIDYSTGGNIDG